MDLTPANENPTGSAPQPESGTSQTDPTLTGQNPTGTREERDSLGSVFVPASAYWGASTARALAHFDYPGERMPIEVVHQLATVKAAAAAVNARLGVLAPDVARLIIAAAEEVRSGIFDAEFPLSVFQTGSGTHTNMNVNEVIANRANELAGRPRGTREPVHPNDHVNRSQSSNDAFPTAANLAVLSVLTVEVLPALDELTASVERHAASWSNVVKLGRTHLQDAVPMTVGDEWLGHAGRLRGVRSAAAAAVPVLAQVPIGGTAVGTGLNAPPGFANAMVAELRVRSDLPTASCDPLMVGLAGADALLHASSVLRQIAVVLFGFANDIRWLSSGPRAGLGELLLPSSEPGSSIMPGKVNPTQCEAAMMVTAQVLGNDATVVFAATQGNLQLNTMRPVLVANVLRSSRLLAGSMRQLRKWLIEELELNPAAIEAQVERSLMLATALTPILGYDRVAGFTHEAHRSGRSLREVVLASGAVGAARYDELVNPLRMARPHDHDGDVIQI